MKAVRKLTDYAKLTPAEHWEKAKGDKHFSRGYHCLRCGGPVLNCMNILTCQPCRAQLTRTTSKENSK